MPNHWKPYAAKTKLLEEKYKPAIERIIVKFRKQFISHYKQSPHSAHAALNQITLHQDIATLIQSIYKTAGLMGARMTNEEIKKQATLKAAGFGRNDIWVRDVVNYLKLHMLEFVSGITDTMRQDILNILQKAVENGWSIDETVNELSKTSLMAARAVVIARTEINRAANVGHTIAAQSLPYEVDKKWVAAVDHRTRHSHRLINNHQVSETGYFEVQTPKGGTEQMLFPGDPDASAANTVNCRCRVIYIPKRDSQGRLLIRDRAQAPVIPMRRPSHIPAADIAAVLKENVFIGVEK